MYLPRSGVRGGHETLPLPLHQDLPDDLIVACAVLSERKSPLRYTVLLNMRPRYLSLANFTCRFGDLVLLDLAEEIVLPAFLRTDVRESRGSAYSFADQSVVSLDDGRVLAIAGRFLKKTLLIREQFIDDDTGELVRQPSTLPSAPSAIFVLILNSHRLIYCPETAFAPPVESFGPMAKKLLKKEHDRFLRGVAKTRRASDGKLNTLKALREQYPEPSVSVVPVAGSSELREFIANYKLLKSAQVELLDVNEEIDNNEFFRAVRAQKDSAGARSTKITHSNKDGLERDNVFEQLKGAATQGTARIVLRGIDQSGATVRGDNNKFTLRIGAPDVPEEPASAAQILYDAARSLGAAASKASDTITKRVGEIYDRWNGRGD